MKPVNSIAQMIARLQQESLFHQSQIEKNIELIEELGPLAEWAEESEQVVPLQESVPESSN
jgi:hypothetical protein